MAVVPGKSPPPPGVSLHARTSIPRVVPFRKERCPLPRRRIDLPGTTPVIRNPSPRDLQWVSQTTFHVPVLTFGSAGLQHFAPPSLSLKILEGWKKTSESEFYPSNTECGHSLMFTSHPIPRQREDSGRSFSRIFKPAFRRIGAYTG